MSKGNDADNLSWLFEENCEFDSIWWYNYVGTLKEYHTSNSGEDFVSAMNSEAGRLLNFYHLHWLVCLMASKVWIVLFLFFVPLGSCMVWPQLIPIQKQWKGKVFKLSKDEIKAKC